MARTGRPRRRSASTTRPPTPPTRPAAPVTRMGCVIVQPSVFPPSARGNRGAQILRALLSARPGVRGAFVHVRGGGAVDQGTEQFRPAVVAARVHHLLALSDAQGRYEEAQDRYEDAKARGQAKEGTTQTGELVKVNAEENSISRSDSAGGLCGGPLDRLHLRR